MADRDVSGAQADAVARAQRIPRALSHSLIALFSAEDPRDLSWCKNAVAAPISERIAPLKGETPHIPRFVFLDNLHAHK